MAEPTIKAGFRTDIPGIPNVEKEIPFPFDIGSLAADPQKTAIRNPVNYCPSPPSATCNIYIRMPFGAPPIRYYSKGCDGCQVVIPQLNMSLSFLFPFLTMLGCFVDLGGRVLNLFTTDNAIKYDKNSPNNPTDFARLPFCLVYIPIVNPNPCSYGTPDVSFAANPIALVDWVTNTLPEALLAIPQFFICIGKFFNLLVPLCQFFVDVVRTLIGLLGCLVRAINTIIANSAEITRLSDIVKVTGSLNLAKSVECLKIQNSNLRASFNLQLNSLRILITLINLIVQITPGFRDVICSELGVSCDKSKPFIDLAHSEDIAELLNIITETIDLLKKVYKIGVLICPASAQEVAAGDVPNEVTL